MPPNDTAATVGGPSAPPAVMHRSISRGTGHNAPAHASGAAAAAGRCQVRPESTPRAPRRLRHHAQRAARWMCSHFERLECSSARLSSRAEHTGRRISRCGAHRRLVATSGARRPPCRPPAPHHQTRSPPWAQREASAPPADRARLRDELIKAHLAAALVERFPPPPRRLTPPAPPPLRFAAAPTSSQPTCWNLMRLRHLSFS